MLIENNCEHEIKDMAKFEAFLATGVRVPSRENHAATLGEYGVIELDMGEGYADGPAYFYGYCWIDEREGFFEVYDGSQGGTNTKHATLRDAAAHLYASYYNY